MLTLRWLTTTPRIAMRTSLLALAACTENIVTPVPQVVLPFFPAATLDLQASLQNVARGQRVTLTWAASNVTDCVGSWQEEPLSLRGSMALQPDRTLTYSITCSGPAGGISRSQAITVAKSHDDSRLLPVAAGVEQSNSCCWAVAAEMILRFYGRTDLETSDQYLCDVALSSVPDFDCGSNRLPCTNNATAGLTESRAIIGFRTQSPIHQSLSRAVCGDFIARALSPEEIREEIDAQRPVILVFKAVQIPGLPNLALRAAVVIGYDFNGIDAELYVNDPFPFGSIFGGQVANPYLSAGGVETKPGQYRISMVALKGAFELAHTIYRIE